MQGVFHVRRISNNMLLDAATHVLREPRVLLCHGPFLMPAPLFAESHKQWTAKGGHLVSRGNAATLKHNAFTVFHIKQQTRM